MLNEAFKSFLWLLSLYSLNYYKVLLLRDIMFYNVCLYNGFLSFHSVFFLPFDAVLSILSI